MEAAVECTHCRVVMTSWSAPGSPIRYYQCPFCQRTHSSLYGEVFRRRAGARVIGGPAVAGTPEQIPMASAEDVRWANVKATAARWFARIEAEETRLAPRAAPVAVARAPAAPEKPVARPAAAMKPRLAAGKRHP
jgi:hypothetical protein